MENNLTFLGDCRDEDLIESIFGSVTDFAQQVEKYGDNFVLDDICVKYDEKTDIHSFFDIESGLKNKSYFCKECGCMMISCAHKK